MDIKSLIKKGPSTRPPKIMLIGVEGVGKSTAGANMPSPVFMCSESGLVGPQFADVPNFTPKSWRCSTGSWRGPCWSGRRAGRS